MKATVSYFRVALSACRYDHIEDTSPSMSLDDPFLSTTGLVARGDEPFWTFGINPDRAIYVTPKTVPGRNWGYSRDKRRRDRVFGTVEGKKISERLFSTKFVKTP